MKELSQLFKEHFKVGRLRWLAVGMVIAVALSACGAAGSAGPTQAPPLPTAAGGGEAAALPTPVAGEAVGTGARSAALDTPEGTWGNYLRDMIAEANQSLTSKVDLIERYQDPNVTQINLNGIATEMELVGDRTTFQVSVSGNAASSNVDFDVRLTYANGDKNTRTCRFAVEIDKGSDGKWYVLNPGPLAVFSVCTP